MQTAPTWRGRRRAPTTRSWFLISPRRRRRVGKPKSVASLLWFIQSPFQDDDIEDFLGDFRIRGSNFLGGLGGKGGGGGDGDESVKMVDGIAVANPRMKGALNIVPIKYCSLLQKMNYRQGEESFTKVPKKPIDGTKKGIIVLGDDWKHWTTESAGTASPKDGNQEDVSKPKRIELSNRFKNFSRSCRARSNSDLVVKNRMSKHGSGSGGGGGGGGGGGSGWGTSQMSWTTTTKTWPTSPIQWTTQPYPSSRQETFYSVHTTRIFLQLILSKTKTKKSVA